ncbi:MFS transporter [Bauldia litoralis]|uniref:Predicted arabinose efflux permease, MFS family n=1 Tax=Bauldia litoralis TaxID=665467 RepID=A0A1G6DRN7_9HYPH|nr:MFS transporter [Bauldia litoralis]SDB47877.1 Predicted arabinose efflux permease, MFS family [Bauldia litoralis]
MPRDYPGEPFEVRRARYAASTVFLIFGSIVGFWFVHIPVVAGRLGLEPAVLGLALLCLGVGSLAFQPVAGLIVGRVGSKRATVVFAVAFLIAFPVVVNVPNVPLLFVALIATGMVGGALNVSVNTQASRIETARARPSMSVFHGFFSSGVLLASVAGGTMINHGWDDGSGVVAAGAILIPIALIAGRWLLADETAGPAGTKKGPRFTLPPPALLGLVLLAFLSNTIEFTVNDWSALFLTTEKGMSAGDAASGLGLFALAMAVSRFAGGKAVERLGARRVVVAGGLTAALGMVVVLSASWPLLSASGFLLIGIGAANLAPLFMSQASHMPGVEPAVGVAATATGLTAGFLLAPPIIGFIAQAFTLPLALGLTVVAGLFITAGALRRTWADVSAPSGA